MRCAAERDRAKDYAVATFLNLGKDIDDCCVTQAGPNMSLTVPNALRSPTAVFRSEPDSSSVLLFQVPSVQTVKSG